MTKILLSAWAAENYSPAPSAWTLRKWRLRGELYPAPEKVGHQWYVSPETRRVLAPQPVRASVVDRLRAA